jgi:hypothetical protein
MRTRFRQPDDEDYCDLSPTTTCGGVAAYGMMQSHSPNLSVLACIYEDDRNTNLNSQVKMGPKSRLCPSVSVYASGKFCFMNAVWSISKTNFHNNTCTIPAK